MQRGRLLRRWGSRSAAAAAGAAVAAAAPAALRLGWLQPAAYATQGGSATGKVQRRRKTRLHTLGGLRQQLAEGRQQAGQQDQRQHYRLHDRERAHESACAIWKVSSEAR